MKAAYFKKYLKKDRKLYAAFMDLKKTYDRVDRMCGESME